MVEKRTKGSFAGFKRVSWGAIFAGTAVALVVYFMLNLLGLAIGLTALDFGAGNPLEGLGVGAGIWWLLSTIIALFVGGWASGRSAGLPFKADSVTHGLVTFSLFTIVTLYLMTTGIGAVVSGAGSLIGRAFSAVASQEGILGIAGQAVPNIDPNVSPAQASEAAEQAAAGISTGAFLAFLALLLGGGAALLGGLVGTPRHAPVAETTDRIV